MTGDEPQFVVEPDELRGMLGLPDRDEFEATEGARLDEEDAEVQAQFEELWGASRRRKRRGGARHVS